jgi:hypothetical protein
VRAPGCVPAAPGGTLNNEWTRPPRGGGHPLRDVSLSQYVCNFSRFVFWQIHDRITQVLGWALGLSVPDHPVALGTPSDKEAGKMGFVGHFVLSLRTTRRVVMAPTVRFSFRAIKALSIFDSSNAKSCASSAGVHGRLWAGVLASFPFGLQFPLSVRASPPSAARGFHGRLFAFVRDLSLPSRLRPAGSHSEIQARCAGTRSPRP